MLRHIVIGWVSFTVALGCSPSTVVFNPQKHPDVKRIALTQYENVKIQQQYTKSVTEKYSLARSLNARRGGSNAAGAAFMIPDPTGGIIAGTILLVGLTAAAAESEVFRQRSERLNANGLHANVAPGVHSTIQTRLTKLGYSVTPAKFLKSDSFDSNKPANLGKSMPTLEKSKVLAQSKEIAAKGELLLVLNTLTMGVEQRDKFGKKPTFHPFVVIGVRGYRIDTGAIAAKYDLVSIAPNPLPITKDLDSAIADKAVLKKAYDEAVSLAIDEIVGDFDRSESVVQLAKPAAKPNDPKVKPSAQAK